MHSSNCVNNVYNFETFGTEMGVRRNTTNIALRPSHRKIKTKAISQPTPLDGSPALRANGT
jgi:hypothetical protein